MVITFIFNQSYPVCSSKISSIILFTVCSPIWSTINLRQYLIVTFLTPDQFCITCYSILNCLASKLNQYVKNFQQYPRGWTPTKYSFSTSYFYIFREHPNRKRYKFISKPRGTFKSYMNVSNHSALWSMMARRVLWTCRFLICMKCYAFVECRRAQTLRYTHRSQ